MEKGDNTMEEQQRNQRQPNPRRKKKTQIEIFKEVYLPAIIACTTLILILVFIIGSIVHAIQRNQFTEQLNQQASIAEEHRQALQRQEAEQLLAEADILSQHYDYDGAIALLDSFSGDSSKFPQLAEKRLEYSNAKNALVLWENPHHVLNLSFQLLIADPARAFSDSTYGTSYNRNFITTDEFSRILQQLYENDYILISLSDLMADGQVKDLYLPENKKPVILTQTQVNYYTYMTDSDGDKLPDANGDGFASKLIIDSNGNLTCEMVDASGQTVTGSYDMIPILDAFVTTHPDFSYKGAKAVLAVTGYDGLFGYRTNANATSFDLSEQRALAMSVVEKLRSTGYELACYTYENKAYGSITADKIQSDLNMWRAEVAPILGNVDTLVFARNSDIASASTAYSGDKYDILHAFGFKNYLGFCTNGKPWLSLENTCIRQGRLMVTGSNLAHKASWFDGIFDPTSVLDTESRGTIPS